MKPSPAITPIPNRRDPNWSSESFGFSSFKRSGRTVTRAICKNPPAVNGWIHDVRASAEWNDAFINFIFKENTWDIELKKYITYS